MRSLPAAFLESARRDPEKVLLRFEGESYTYGEVLTSARRIAGALTSWGLAPGERVALHLPNRPAFVETYLGILWTGAIAVPVNTAYRETELTHILGDSEPRLVVTDAAGAREVERVPEGVRPSLLVLGEAERDAGAWSALAPGAEPSAEPTPASTDIANLGYTSGTTGRSKGAMLTHGAFLANSAAVTTAWEWTAEDHLLLTLPLFHMHGLGVGLHGTLLAGSTITLTRRFEAGNVLDTLATGGCTMYFGVPTMYHRLVAEAPARARPRGVRLYVSGSAPLSAETHAAFERAFGARILERYGMTETAMNTGNPYRGARKPGSVGLPFPGVDVRVADPKSGCLLDHGETGEVQVKGPNLFDGYWRQDRATREAFTPDGWFRTGDLGFRDADGYLFLTGRASDLIITGGFNVHPREVEDVIESHPSVAEAAVVGLPDPDLGERVAAAIVARSSVDAEELASFLAPRLARFKVPRQFHFVEALPRNALGKIQRFSLRETLGAGASRGDAGSETGRGSGAPRRL